MTALESTGSLLSLRNEALQVAITQIGKQENPKGSNWGDDVSVYLKSVGINFPASWCMAFVYWCFEKAAEELGVSNPMVKTGGVLAQYNASKKLYLVKGVPKAGDVFIMDFGHGLGHTGIIEIYDDSMEQMHTIEGNTNNDGSRNGFEVERKIRNVNSSLIKGFLRFT